MIAYPGRKEAAQLSRKFLFRMIESFLHRDLRLWAALTSSGMPSLMFPPHHPPNTDPFVSQLELFEEPKKPQANVIIGI